MGGQPVGDTAHQGVGRNAGQAVGTAALQADHQLLRTDGLPPILGRPVCQAAQQPLPLRQLVFHRLALRKATRSSSQSFSSA